MAHHGGSTGIARRRVIALAGGAIVAAGTGAALVSRGRRPPGVPNLELVRHLDFTYLPGTVRRDTWYRDLDRESISGTTPSSAAHATLTWPAPPPDDLDSGNPWIVAGPGDRVQGLPTAWRTAGAGSAASPVVLRWERAAGRWAELVLGGIVDAATIPLAARVAAGARFDLAEPVRLPVRSPSLVGALRLQQVRVEDHDDELWSVSLTYATGSPPAPDRVPYPSAQVRVAPMTELERYLMGIAANAPNTTVDGHAAHQQFDPPDQGYHEFLKVWNVDGLLVVLDVFGADVRDLLAPDGAAALYRTLRLSPDWR